MCSFSIDIFLWLNTEYICNTWRYHAPPPPLPPLLTRTGRSLKVLRTTHMNSAVQNYKEVVCANFKG